MYRPIALGVVAALERIFHERAAADKVIEHSFKLNRKWGSRDRRQFAETVYDIVRYYRALCWQAGIAWPESDQPPVLGSLELWRVLAVYGYRKSLKIDGAPDVTPRAGLESQSRAVRLSFPDWLDHWASQQVPEWDLVAPELNRPARVFLRVNRLKATPEDVLSLLRDRGLKVRGLNGDALVLEERANVFATDEFARGLFEVQDLHSQAIAPLLDARPGERVVDACAGAGGKTLHMASLMNNKGKILALDVHERKLEELKKRSRRAGVHLIETRLIDSNKTVKRLEQSADRLLLDVPCTGLGVLRRNPDAKWKLAPERVQRLEELQAEILESYWRMLKPGGVLVYATCSIARSENEDQIRHFLERHSADFELERELKLPPGADGGDGFYACRLRLRPS